MTPSTAAVRRVESIRTGPPAGASETGSGTNCRCWEEATAPASMRLLVAGTSTR